MTERVQSVRMRRPRTALALFSLFAGLLSLPSAATAVVLNPAADTFITEHTGLGGADSTHGSDGGDLRLWLVPANTARAFPLIRFDLSGFAGHDVLGDGVLTLPIATVHPSRPPAVSQTVSVHQSLVAWDETTVTWNTFGPTAGPSGDFGPSLSQVVLPAGQPSVGSTLSFSIPETVLQSWIDAPAANLGLLIFSPPNVNQLDLVFRNRESTEGDPAQIAFETDGGGDEVRQAPEPASLALLGIGFGGLALLLRRRGASAGGDLGSN